MSGFSFHAVVSKLSARLSQRSVLLSCFSVSVIALLGLFESTSAFAYDGRIRLPATGYLPERAKLASLVGRSSSYQLIDAQTQEIVFEAELNEGDQLLGEGAQAEDVFLLDFSSVKKRGTYFLRVAEIGDSHTFQISDDALDDALLLSMVGFYGWRANLAISLEHQGQVFAHAAGHGDDGQLDYVGGAGMSRDGLGGWYDAGDYGKYVVNGAFTAGMMLAAWEHFSPQLENLKLPIPEAEGEFPDYLDEIKYELDYLLKMQVPSGSDAGAAYHKLTPLGFSGTVMPADDDSERYFSPISSAATADLAAVLAQGSRIFQEFDAAYAARLLGAAKDAQDWLQSPRGDDYLAADLSSFSTGAYQSGNSNEDQDDRIWALAELWESTGEAGYLTQLETRISALGNNKVVPRFDWSNVSNLGIYVYALSSRAGRDAALLAEVRGDIIQAAAGISERSSIAPFGKGELGFAWGSNGTVARSCMTLQVAYQLDAKGEFQNACLAQISYLYGRNQYGRSQVTGHGKQPPQSPHDRRSEADDVAAPYPGLLVGGGHTEDDWIDVYASYRTNEVAVNWNGALVYALAGFSTGTKTYDGKVGGTAPPLKDADPLPPSAPCEVLTDFEEGVTTLPEINARGGKWYALSDGTAAEPKLQQSTGYESSAALLAEAEIHSSWGAGFGVTLNENDEGLRPYDLSYANGISFMARLTQGDSGVLKVVLPDINTQQSGGICEVGDAGNCNDHFHSTVNLTDEWQQYQVDFRNLRQAGWGYSAGSFSKEQVFALEFQVGTEAALSVEIDNIGLSLPGGCEVEGEGQASKAGEQGTADDLSAMGGSSSKKLRAPAGDDAEGGGCGCHIRGQKGQLPPAAFALALLGCLALFRRLSSSSRKN